MDPFDAGVESRIMHKSLVLAVLGISLALQAQKAKAANPIQKPADSQQNKYQPEARGTENLPLVVHDDGRSRSNEETKWNQQHESEEASGKRIERYFSGVVALSALLQIAVLFMQWWLFRRQTRIMRGSLVQARRAANAARTSANDARETARVTQCADVLIEYIEMFDAQPLRIDSGVSIVFKNFGPTRAHNVVFDFQLIAASIFNLPSSPVPVVMGSTESKPLIFKRFKDVMQPTDVPAIASGQAVLRFEGSISYVDVFGTQHKIACEGRFDAPTRSFPAKQTIILPVPKQDA
jgi:hypothetical protein